MCFNLQTTSSSLNCPVNASASQSLLDVSIDKHFAENSKALTTLARCPIYAACAGSAVDALEPETYDMHTAWMCLTDEFILH